MLQDVSAMVRKRAIQLLTIAINYFFVLFVESQNKTKFLTLEEIERVFKKIIIIYFRKCNSIKPKSKK